MSTKHRLPRRLLAVVLSLLLVLFTTSAASYAAVGTGEDSSDIYACQFSVEKVQLTNLDLKNTLPSMFFDPLLPLIESSFDDIVMQALNSSLYHAENISFGEDNCQLSDISFDTVLTVYDAHNNIVARNVPMNQMLYYSAPITRTEVVCTAAGVMSCSSYEGIQLNFRSSFTASFAVTIHVDCEKLSIPAHEIYAHRFYLSGLQLANMQIDPLATAYSFLSNAIQDAMGDILDDFVQSIFSQGVFTGELVLAENEELASVALSSYKIYADYSITCAVNAYDQNGNVIFTDIPMDTLLFGDNRVCRVDVSQCTISGKCRIGSTVVTKFAFNYEVSVGMEASPVHDGDVLYFGSYPTEKVLNTNTIAALNAEQADWCRRDATTEYADVSLGQYTYRGIRPTGAAAADWYEYEDIAWRVVDSETGTLTAETVLDAFLYDEVSGFKASGIREWMNNSFFFRAFRETDEGVMRNSPGVDRSPDYVVLESADSANAFPQTWVTDYAAAEGAGSDWLVQYEDALYAVRDGKVVGNAQPGTVYGIRPVIRLNMAGNCRHTYNTVTAVDANCVQGSHTLFTCTQCGDSFRIFRSANNKNVHTHTIKLNEEAATCSVTGYSGDIFCEDCGRIVSAGDEIGIDPDCHCFQHMKDESTCAVNGMEYDFCLYCGNIFNAVKLPLAEHTFGEWTVTVQPTCTAKGEKERTCSVCLRTETADVDALGHDFSEEWTVITPATCASVGYKAHSCIRCTAVSDVTEIPTLEHTFGEWYVVSEPTLLAEGLKRRDCVCGAYETDRIEKLPAETKEDPVTGISVTYEDGIFEDGVVVNVSEQYGEDFFRLFNAEVGNFATKLYDITPTLNSEKVQPNGTVLVSIPVPAGFNTDRIVVYHMTSEGTFDKLDSFVQDGNVYFYTDHFSRFVIADTAQQSQVDTGETEKPCDCACHQGGFAGFIWKIKCFFYRLFNIERYKYCQCGKAHW